MIGFTVLMIFLMKKMPALGFNNLKLLFNKLYYFN